VQYIMFGIEVCVLHNLDMANWCKFHNFYSSVFKYLCVTKKNVELIFNVKNHLK